MRSETFSDHLAEFPDIDGIWDFQDIPKTENVIRGLLPSTGSWGVESIELLTQLARALAIQGKLQEASKTLVSVREQSNNLETAIRQRIELRCLLEQGRIFCFSMTPPQAEACFSQAWTMAQSLNNTFFSIEAALMLALSQPQKLQKSWLSKALDLAETTTDIKSRMWLPQLYTIRGWESFDMRKYNEALEFFNKAIAIKKTFGLEWVIGRSLRALNRLDEAFQKQSQLLTELNALGKINGYVYLEMAECLQLLKNTVEAQKYFDLAHKSLLTNKWFADNRAHELSRILHLAKAK